MNAVKVRFKKLNAGAKMPDYGTEYAAGADLYACMEEPLTIKAGTTEFVNTGIAMEIPEGLVGLIYARSGLACKRGVAPANKVGVIDIESGERVAQMVITPYVFAEYEESGELQDSVRGAGGFGSTGMK